MRMVDIDERIQSHHLSTPPRPTHSHTHSHKQQDLKKQRMNERHDAPGEIRRTIEQNEVENVVRRGRMMLPSPQVSDLELAALAKMQAEGRLEEGGEGARRLLGDYTQVRGMRVHIFSFPGLFPVCRPENHPRKDQTLKWTLSSIDH